MKRTRLFMLCMVMLITTFIYPSMITFANSEQPQFNTELLPLENQIPSDFPSIPDNLNHGQEQKLHKDKESKGNKDEPVIMSIDPPGGPSLVVNNKSTDFITVTVTYPISGVNGNGLYYFDYDKRTWTSISNTWYTTNGVYTIPNLRPYKTYHLWYCYYTDSSNTWLKREFGFNDTTSASTINAADLSVISGGGLSDLISHSFISIRNITNSNIQIGNLYPIAPGKTIYVGTWGNTEEINDPNKGLFYNLEPFKINVLGDNFGQLYTLSEEINSSELNTLNNLIYNSDHWGPIQNCSYFAATAWNSVADTRVNASSNEGLSINAPLYLQTNMLGTGKAVQINYLIADYGVMYTIGSQAYVSVMYR